jgi:hypothetical protein
MKKNIKAENHFIDLYITNKQILTVPKKEYYVTQKS